MNSILNIPKSFSVGIEFCRTARRIAPALLLSGAGVGCAPDRANDIAMSSGTSPHMPAPADGSRTVQFATASGWPDGKTPSAPPGFRVTKFADKLDHPRWLYCLSNGDVLVAESAGKPKKPASEEEFQKLALFRMSGEPRPSADRISLLRDTDRDGVADERHVLLEGLNQPLGMAVVGDWLYVANTDGLVRFRFQPGETRISLAGDRLCALPAGGYNNHWTRNILADSAGTGLYITVGSSSNIAERGISEETRRANVLHVDLSGMNETVVASGLRNPVGLAFEPTTGKLWTAVNERDLLGDDLVPDYLTSVSPGDFYGWPYSYWGNIVDQRVKPARPELVATAKQPDYALGAHTASLGLAFGTSKRFPPRWQGGAFVGQHGSWNRSVYSGYKVIYVPFRDGRPEGKPQDFLTGFMADPATGLAYGRPVGVAFDAAGGLLVADDAGDVVWRVDAETGGQRSSQASGPDPVR